MNELIHVILVERKSHFRFRNSDCLILNNRDYINKPEILAGKRARIINLSRDYSYLGYGYYCSLLAEARLQKVVPSVSALLDLRERSIYRHALPDLDDQLRATIRKMPEEPGGAFSLHLFFGRAEDPRFQDLARKTFDAFRCPLLKLSITPDDGWSISSIKPMSLEDLRLDQQSLFEDALESYMQTSWRLPKTKAKAKYSLAVLHNPKEKMPPSSPRTLQKFVRMGEAMGVDVELIERKDYGELAEYDALFIRETTAIDHHTYRFAKKAENEGMPVIDDPTSILRCTNKVYLAELLRAHKVPTPKTIVLDARGLSQVEQEFTYPLVMKIPDGSFSRGTIKIANRQELNDGASALLKESDLILAQEYMYTDFDWRIGILNGKAIYACRYFMSRGHWQIVKHEDSGRYKEGGFETIPVEAAPAEVISTALKAAALIGDGFYGVDLKQTDKGVFVIEINDNPSIDQGCEDAVLKDDLYRLIIEEFIARLEQRSPKPQQQLIEVAPQKALAARKTPDKLTNI